MITSKSGDGDESSLLIRWRRSSKLAGKNDKVKFLTEDFPHQNRRKSPHMLDLVEGKTPGDSFNEKTNNLTCSDFVNQSLTKSLHSKQGPG